VEAPPPRGYASGRSAGARWWMPAYRQRSDRADCNRETTALCFGAACSGRRSPIQIHSAVSGMRDVHLTPGRG
jgi:hypothetical protein